MRCGKDHRLSKSQRQFRRNPRECAVAKGQQCGSRKHTAVATRTNALWQRLGQALLQNLPTSRNPHECAVAKRPRLLLGFTATPSQPARMRCGKGRCDPPAGSRLGRNPHECAVAKACVRRVNFIRFGRNPHECAVAKMGGYSDFFCCYVATRTNALWQSDETCKTFTADGSQPARMRCGKVAPLLCPNRKLREHELRSSFLVSPPVILVVTFYMTAQLLKRFSTCTAKTAASKLSDAAVYSFNK